MPILTAGAIDRLGATVLVAAGVPDDEAAIVARHLAGANLVGHDSHGLSLLPGYVRFISEGMFVPGAPFEVVSESETTGLYDGGWGMGQVQAGRALERLLELAAQQGFASAGLRRTGHIGRLGDYVERAAAAGMLGVCAVSGSVPEVAPWGGIDRRLGTNPIAYGVPTGKGFVMVYDAATSVVAQGKVKLHHNQGSSVPEGWIIDKDGNPTTDPNDYYEGGAILPFGEVAGHKGYGLSVMVEVLASGLGGSWQAAETEPWHYACNGVFMMAIHIEALRPLEEFIAEVDALIDHVKSSRLAPGFKEILVPGEFEARTRLAREQDGVLFDDETWSQIVETAEGLGVDAEAHAQS
jgi:uncharacterized oxidoreductase